MIVGVDFDNTIVCYDRLFHRLAVERGWLAAETPAAKGAVRDRLRAAGREGDWTRLQGIAYGERLGEAEAFPGVREFMLRCRAAQIPVYIVSHKTRTPFEGPACDLHEAAHRWLDRNGFYDGVGLASDSVFFEITKEEKLRRIRQLGCTVFVDDLSEFLAEPGFPAGVRRVLFDPHGRSEGREDSAGSWEELTRIVPAAATLLSEVGLSRDARVVRIRGGANNRVYRVGDDAVLKVYYRDERRRGIAEYAFARFAWDRGITTPARPLAFDPQAEIGLYEFVDGRPLNADDVDRHRVLGAAEFIRALNRHRDHPAARDLPAAAEACFSAADHVRSMEHRLERLRRIEDPAAVKFVEGPIGRAWDSLAPGLRDLSSEKVPLCLSPSDFGFHNALVGSDGRLRFLDFEYAGWDDPAKLICDFLAQPEYRVVPDLAAEFLTVATAALPDPEGTRARARRLLPLHRLKWCCILLNEFVPADRERRRFAYGGGDEGRLRKAELLLSAIQEPVLR